MAQSPINIPPFMMDYYEGTDHEGKARLEIIADNYEKQRQDFMQNKYPAKAIFQDDWNRLSGQNERLKPDQLIWHIQEEHRVEAEKIAKQFSYVEKTAERVEPKAKVSKQANQKKQVPKMAQKVPPAADQPAKQAVSQQASQPNRREVFLQTVRQQRQRQVQARQTQEPPPGTGAQSSAEQGNRERFAAKLKAMRTQSPKITHRPK